jgi:hypothetical protein
LDSHEQYEELCALAASGQASKTELADLQSHVEECPNCRGMVHDFTQVSAQALSVLAAKRSDFQIPRGMTQRFIARAHAEGIDMTRTASPKGLKPDWHFPFRFAGICTAAAALLVVASVVSLLIIKPKFSGLRAERGHIASPQLPTTSAMHPESAQAQDMHFQEQLAAARAELNSMAATIKAQHAELESADQNLSSLDSRLVEAEQRNADFQSERTEREARIKQLETELEKSKTEKNADDVALALQETELREVRKQVSDQTAALEQQQALAARGSDVRDLVVARNLHIVDVHDSGGGKNQKAFGRIFYTEGKSLIYYAYDLADPRKVDAKVSFYVWGERLGSEKPIRSLGILHSDDASDGRWVLTFDDPKVLAQIDSVFVTAESSKKLVREPQGERRLFTFLGDKPNHP